MSKPIVRLDAWRLIRMGGRPVTLLGFATGHPLLPGYLRSIRTSLVLAFEPDRYRAETLNTFYWLGHPMESCLRDPDGRLAQFVLAGFLASRDPATGVWSASDHQRDLQIVGSSDIEDVLDRILAAADPIPTPAWLPQ
jgi:hypothetical protein